MSTGADYTGAGYYQGAGYPGAGYPGAGYPGAAYPGAGYPKVPGAEPYVQSCDVVDCTHVLIKVGQPAVDFTLCKPRLVLESKFFKAAFEEDKFTEGNQFEMELKEEDPSVFKMFVQSMFPEHINDYGRLQGKNLENVMRCADQYDAYGSTGVAHRLFHSVSFISAKKSKSMHETSVLMEAFVAVCKYNLDKKYCQEIRRAVIHNPELYQWKGKIPDDVFVDLLIEQLKLLNNSKLKPSDLAKM